MMTIGSFIGLIALSTMRSRKRIAEINLKLCFPLKSDTERSKLLTENFKSMGKGLMEVAIAWWWSDERIRSLQIETSGLEHLHSSNGTIFLTAHFSSLELSARLLGQHAESYAMYRPHANEVLQYHYEKYRSKYSLGIISRDDVRSMAKALKHNKGIWFAPDQNFARKGFVFSSFFGIHAATNPATSRFAELTGADVVPFNLVRTPNGYKLSFENKLNAFPSGSLQKDTNTINSIFQNWASKYPSQYNWIHRRFKTQPDKITPPYIKPKRVS
jgi:KDO2-lipid IV(A) lauroyltransferase